MPRAKATERKSLNSEGDSPVLAVTQQETLEQGQIVTNGGTQMRAGLRGETVSDYAEKMEVAGGWGPFPSVDVVYDGKTYWLTDGFHRLAASMSLFAPDFAIPVNITPGDFKKALLAAAKANDTHGLPRSNADKRRTITRLLEEPEWATLSDGALADMALVTARFVGAVREEMEMAGKVAPSPARTGKDGRVTNVAKVGRAAAPKAEPAPAPKAEPAPAPVGTGFAPVAVPTHVQPALVEEPEPVITFEASAPAPLPPVEEEVEKPAELITFVLRRGVATKIYGALTSQALRDFLTPSETDDVVKSLNKGLNQGVRS